MCLKISFLAKKVEAGRASKTSWVVDGYSSCQKGPEDMEKVVEIMGSPDHAISLDCAMDVLKQRAKGEEEELGEEAVAKLDADVAALGDKVKWWESKAAEAGRAFHDIKTDTSMETTTGQLDALFAPKVILVNHEKRLTTDTTCANIAIKFNMLTICQCTR